MGGSYYSHDDYAARSTVRAATGAPVFKHDHAIKTGAAKGVHPSLDPKGVTLRESRDSAEHPVTMPIAVIMDTTGSMGQVPVTLEKNLSALMGHFLEDRASGKSYLGDAYPAIMVGAVDDYAAMGGGDGARAAGTFQIGQFESGIEIDNDLENLWITGMGGGTYEESYELALYFMARHTAHDAGEKRGKKGYLFLVGDEHAYEEVSAAQVATIISTPTQGNIPTDAIIREAQMKYHVFFIIPNLTQHYSDPELHRYWVEKLGQQNVILLEDPEKICEAIVAAVAISEGHVGIDGLTRDGVVDGALSTALATLAGSAVARRDAGGLAPIPGSPGEIERL